MIVIYHTSRIMLQFESHIVCSHHSVSGTARHVHAKYVRSAAETSVITSAAKQQIPSLVSILQATLI